MNKPYTLLGAMGNMVRMYTDGSIPTVIDMDIALANYIRENVNQNFIDSLSSKKEEPTTSVYDGVTFFFANGTPIEIMERPDSEDGALIVWETGELAVDINANIFGGRHDDETPTNGAIIISGGHVRNIFGGGLHKSHTVRTSIYMMNGIVSSISGAGASSLTKACGCNDGAYYSGDPTLSPCVTDETIITVAGGTITNYVYAGNEGIGYCKKATVILGGNAKTGYLTAGGSNGQTDECKVTIQDNATIDVLQGINRGIVKSVTMIVNGGHISKMFAGGEIPFVGSSEAPNGSDASGKFDSALISIKDGSIGKFSYGGHDYNPITEESEIMKSIKLNIINPSVIKVTE